MSTYVTGFQSFLKFFFASFSIGKISHQHYKGLELQIPKIQKCDHFLGSKMNLNSQLQHPLAGKIMNCKYLQFPCMGRQGLPVAKSDLGICLDPHLVNISKPPSLNK